MKMDLYENEFVTENLPALDGSDAKGVADAIAEILDSKKARDIKVLHVEDKTVIAEYFVFRTEQRGLPPYSVEGRDNNSWILLDYSNVIVHIFSREAREFYNLEKLYED